jgi:DNA repair protein RadC
MRSIEKEVESLENWEILSLIFRFSEKKSKEIMGDHQKWAAIDPDSLILDQKQRIKVKALLEIHRRFGIEKYKREINMSSTKEACKYTKYLLENKFVEEINIIGLDNGNAIMNIKKYYGTVNQTAINLREIVKYILCSNFANVIVAHNHPGGSLYPSQSDKEFVNKLKTALELYSIKLYDSIIVAYHGETFSFAENGLI